MRKLTDGLFRDVFYEVAREYPEIEARDYVVEYLGLKLVTIPEAFHVLVLGYPHTPTRSSVPFAARWRKGHERATSGTARRRASDDAGVRRVRRVAHRTSRLHGGGGVAAVIDTIARICSVEMLLSIEGVAAYSLAQGQS